MEIVLARVDERLIHGRIINEWIQYVKPSHLLIAARKLAEDAFMSNVYRALVPLWMETVICSEEEAAVYLKVNKQESGRVMVLCESPVGFVWLLESGIKLEEVTLADKRYFPNKIEIPLEYKKALNQLIDAGVSVVAWDSPENESVRIEKYKL